jgi:RNA-directed DNA polymerase
MVRFADDLVMVFTNEKDARRVLDVLPKRLGKYGLTLHPTKTRLLYFRPPSAGGDQTRDTGKQSFDFLGFTHHWARSRRGIWVVMRKTAGSRLSRALKQASQWLRSVRHQPVAQQHEQLVRKYAGTTTTTGFLATSMRCPVSATKLAGSGGGGSTAAPTKPVWRGSVSIAF